MTVVVRDLTGFDLDYWVAKCMGYEAKRHDVSGLLGVRVRFHEPFTDVDDPDNGWRTYHPTGNWGHCGPLLDLMTIFEVQIYEWDEDDGPNPGEPYGLVRWRWVVDGIEKLGVFDESGPLKTAICRAFVASKKGWSFEDEQ